MDSSYETGATYAKERGSEPQPHRGPETESHYSSVASEAHGTRGASPEGVDDDEKRVYRSQDSLDNAALETGRPPVTRTVSKSHSVNNVNAIPNGGLRAWLQVAGSFFLFFNSWGIINTFGVYQTYYETGILRGENPSTISWIGSVQAFLLMLVGALTGPVYDAGYFRYLIAVGSFLVVFGHMMLSICTQYWQAFLAQAICVGLGTGCLFVPSVAILSTYFTTKIATVMGLAAAGSSLGGVIYPIVLYKLIPQIGFGWATRVIGFIALATLLVPNLVMKVRVLPASRRSLIDWSAFREAPYMLFLVGGFLGFMGLYTPFFYVQSYSIGEHITNEKLGFYLLSILNSASVFGRILPNFVADKSGPMNIIIPCGLVSGILTICLIPVHNIGGIVIFCLLYGFFSGSFVSLPPTILVHLSPNRGVIGTRMGMCFAFVSIGVLIGTPIAGAILTASNFTYVWVFGGVLTIIGSLVMCAARVCKAGWGFAAKV